jgi:hypothetical protein
MDSRKKGVLSRLNTPLGKKISAGLLAAGHAHVHWRGGRGGLGGARSEAEGGNGKGEGGKNGFHVGLVGLSLRAMSETSGIFR